MSSAELVNQFNNIYDAVESYASSSAYADFLAHTAHATALGLYLLC